MLEWFLVNEQFGRVTGGLHWHVPSAYNVLMQGSPEQIERYVLAGPPRRGRRRLRGHRGRGRVGPQRDRHPPRSASDGGWRINGEKWFVTSGDVARVLIVMANAVDGSERLPTLFLIEPDAPRRRVRRRPEVHPQLPARTPDDPLHRRRGRFRRGRWRPRQRGCAPAGVVYRGAPRDCHPRAGRDVAAARGDDRLGAESNPGRAADHRLPGGLVPAGGLGHRRRARPAPGPAGRRDGRRGRGREADPRQGIDGQAVRLGGRTAGVPTARSRSSADAVTCAATSPSGSCANSGSTASGKAPARSSG